MKNGFYIYIDMRAVFRASARHSADKGKDKISAVASLEFPQTAQQQKPGSKEEQTDYVKDGTAKQTLP